MDQKKVMIVEDEVIVGLDLTKKLEHLGYCVVPNVIRYGEEVLQAAEKEKPDLILMDVRLKGEKDGTEAAAIIREKLGLPIIFLTAYSDQTTLSKAKKTEPFAYLKKPIRTEDLKISLEMALYKAGIEKSLRESELRFRTVANFTYDWETWIDPEGTYNYTSPSCERVTGYPDNMFYHDPQFFFSIVHPEDKETVQREFEHHLACDKENRSLIFRILHADGTERWIEHFCQPVYAPDGAYIGRRAGNRDISDRKELEFKLEKKVVELQDALDNIKTLKGLIPICANCKKIRDDEGYWNILETYIQKHSDAEFSHGMCPSCMDVFYGNEDWYKDIKDKKGIDSSEKNKD